MSTRNRREHVGRPPHVRGNLSLKPATRDLFAYVAIGLCLAAVAVLSPIVIPEHFWVSHTWYSFIFFTGLLAVVLIKMYWPVKEAARIWLLIALLLAIHTAGYTVLLRHVQEWPAFSYLMTMPIEVIVIAAIIYKCLKVLPPKVRM